MSLEALWSVTFVSNTPSVNNTGGGVVIFETGRVLGGDSGYTYTGTYEIDQNQIKARVRVKQFSPMSLSVFGNNEDFELYFEGEYNDTQFDLMGVMVDQTQNRILVRFTRVEELP